MQQLQEQQCGGEAETHLWGLLQQRERTCGVGHRTAGMAGLQNPPVFCLTLMKSVFWALRSLLVDLNWRVVSAVCSGCWPMFWVRLRALIFPGIGSVGLWVILIFATR